MTPERELISLRPAFLDLFKDERPDLARFLRLVADVLDPATYEGTCSGDGEFLPKGCGNRVRFKQAVRERDGHVFAYGYECESCGTVYPWSLCKGPKRAARRIVITQNHDPKIGDTRSESESGVVVIDR